MVRSARPMIPVTAWGLQSHCQQIRGWSQLSLSRLNSDWANFAMGQNSLVNSEGSTFQRLVCPTSEEQWFRQWHRGRRRRTCRRGALGGDLWLWPSLPVCMCQVRITSVPSGRQSSSAEKGLFLNMPMPYGLGKAILLTGSSDSLILKPRYVPYPPIAKSTTAWKKEQGVKKDSINDEPS